MLVNKNDFMNLLKEFFNKTEDGERWITVHPHGHSEENDDYRRIKVHAGETSKEACDRVFKGKTKEEPKKPQEKDFSDISQDELKAKKKQLWTDLMNKYKGLKNIKEIPIEERRKYLEDVKKIDELLGKKPKEEKKPEDKKTVEKPIEKQIIDKRTEVETLKEKYYKGLDQNLVKSISEKRYQKWQEAKKELEDLSTKMPMVGKTWTINGKTFKVTEYNPYYYAYEGAYKVVDDSAGMFTYTSHYSPAGLEAKIKADEALEAKIKAVKEQREAGIKRGKNVIYEIGQIPKAKTVKEAQEIAYKYDLADSVDYGKLSPEVANAMNEVANDIYTKFPKIRKINKEYGSLQARNTNVIEEAYQIHGSKIEERVRQRFEAIKQRFGKEYFEKYYGDSKKIESEIQKKVKKDITSIYGLSKSRGEVAHCLWSPPKHQGIVFNEKYGKNDKKTLDTFKISEMTKFHPVGCNTHKSSVDHEFGHLIDRYIQVQKATNSEPYRKLKDLWSNKAFNSNITEELSKYGAEKFEEFIAEGFSEARNNPNPRPLAKQITELLTQAYKEAEKNDV